MVKHEDSESEENSNNSSYDNYESDNTNDSASSDETAEKYDLLDRRYKSKRVKVRQTEEGDSIQVLRLKTDDKPFTGNCIRQASAIIYIASVLNSRRKFYTEIWSNVSQIFLDCVKVIPPFTPSPNLSANISHWLNTNSLDFCIFSEYNNALPIRGKKSFGSPKPIGRPRKHANETKLQKPSKYVKKTEIFFDNSQLLRDSANESTNDVPLSNMNSLINVPIFNSKKFRYDVSIMNLNGIDGCLRVKDLAIQIHNLFESSANENYSKLGVKLPSRLPKLFFENLKKEAKKPTYFQTLFCGGPISAISACPRRLNTGEEIVAISTFPDEKLLTHFDEMGHIQFWAYPSDLSSEAKLKFILETPNVNSILNLCWCPLFTNSVFINANTRTTKTSNPNKKFKNFEDTKHILGFLAVSTNIGKVFIYCIPNNFDKLCENTKSSTKRALLKKKSDVLKILRTEPTIVLNHPKIAVRIDESNQEIFFKKIAKQAKNSSEASASVVQSIQNMSNNGDVIRELCEIPITHLRWSPFKKCRMLAGISASGRVLVWDLEKKNPSNQPLIIHSLNWTSPPIAVDWFSASDLCISFRLKCARVYNVDTETFTFKEDTSKSAGQMVVACPSIFPGFFVYDTHFLPFPDIFYSCSSYITFPDKDRKKALMIPTLNAHQVQVSRISVCEGSGSIASVGYDGRLVSTLNGRIKPHDCEKVPGFYTGRTLLHMISHRKKITIEQALENDQLEVNNSKTNSSPSRSQNKSNNLFSKKENELDLKLVEPKRQKLDVSENQDEVIEKLCFSHEECCENKWLEIRIGDATLKDHITMRRMKLKVSDVFLDRRLESLTYVDYSHITPCLSISGGEAGLVFLMPCIY